MSLCVSPSQKLSPEELEDYVNTQFDQLRELVRLEEKRTLHLVDLKEASLTASAAEKIAEISVETERLQEEMASITSQLCLLEQAEAAGDVAAPPAPAHRVQVRSFPPSACVLLTAAQSDCCLLHQSLFLIRFLIK